MIRAIQLKNSTGILAAIVFMAVLILQYPLSSSFPIGGDAARSITRAQAVITSFATSPASGVQTLATNSNYPAVTAFLALLDILPFSWPALWIWLTVGVYIAIGLCIGLVSQKIFGWRESALSIVCWGVLGMAFTQNFIDATLAQLLSIPILLTVIYGFANKQYIASIILLIFTYTLHPLSAAVLVLTIIVSLLGNLSLTQHALRHYKYQLLTLLSISALLAFVVLDKILPIIMSHPASERGFSIHDMLTSPSGPLLVIAPLGLVALHKKNSAAARWFFAYTLVSFMLFWHFAALGESIFLERFQLYFAIAAAILSGIGLSILTQKIFGRYKKFGAICIALLFFGLGLQTWQQNIFTFNLFESPSQYERVHQTEIEAFEWMKENLPKGSTVISTEANRHTEWLPVLTSLNWVGLSEDSVVFRSTAPHIQQEAAAHGYEYAILLKKREGPQEVLPALPSLQTIYENEGVIVVNLQSQ